MLKTLRFGRKATAISVSVLMLLLLVMLLLWRTKGVVVYDAYLYEQDQWRIQMDGRLLLKAKMTPRPTLAKHPYTFPAVEEVSPLGLVSMARDAGSNIRIEITSDRSIESAVIEEVIVRDLNGESRPKGYQQEKLHVAGRGVFSNVFTSPNFGWHGLYINGPAEIDLSGYVVFVEGGEKVEFSYRIEVEALRARSFISRRTWEEANGRITPKYLSDLPEAKW